MLIGELTLQWIKWNQVEWSILLNTCSPEPTQYQLFCLLLKDKDRNWWKITISIDFLFNIINQYQYYLCISSEFTIPVLLLVFLNLNLSGQKFLSSMNKNVTWNFKAYLLSLRQKTVGSVCMSIILEALRRKVFVTDEECAENALAISRAAAVVAGLLELLARVAAETGLRCCNREYINPRILSRLLTLFDYLKFVYSLPKPDLST